MLPDYDIFRYLNVQGQYVSFCRCSLPDLACGVFSVPCYGLVHLGKGNGKMHALGVNELATSILVDDSQVANAFKS